MGNAPVDRHADSLYLLDAVRRLPARQLEVVVLRFYLDLTVPEVAAVLRVSADTVKSRCARGLASLKEAIAMIDLEGRLHEVLTRAAEGPHVVPDAALVRSRSADAGCERQPLPAGFWPCPRLWSSPEAAVRVSSSGLRRAPPAAEGQFRPCR